MHLLSSHHTDLWSECLVLPGGQIPARSLSKDIVWTWQSFAMEELNAVEEDHS